MKTSPDFYIRPGSKEEKHLLDAGERVRFDLALRLNNGMIGQEEYEKKVALTYMPGKSAREMTATEAKAALAEIDSNDLRQRNARRDAADQAAIESKHSAKAGKRKA